MGSCFLISIFVVLLCFISRGVVSDQILSVHTAGSLSRSSREPKYRIEFHSEDSPFQPDDDQESLPLSTRKEQKYLCFLPKVEKIKSEKLVSQQNTSSLIMETEKQVKVKTPDELLENFKDVCFTRQEGWWTYEFCYHKKLRQLHLEDEKDPKVVQEFVLGEYDPEATAAYHENHSDVSTLKDPRSEDLSRRYHAHIYNNGTICDLTNKPRETEVRFVCSEPKAMISSITELSTCKYALTVYAPMLCEHPLFREERPVWHTIHCNLLPWDVKQKKATEKGVRDEEIKMVIDTVSMLGFEKEE